MLRRFFTPRLLLNYLVISGISLPLPLGQDDVSSCHLGRCHPVVVTAVPVVHRRCSCERHAEASATVRGMFLRNQGGERANGLEKTKTLSPPLGGVEVLQEDHPVSNKQAHFSSAGSPWLFPAARCPATPDPRPKSYPKLCRHPTPCPTSKPTYALRYPTPYRTP